jgi:hypothetical protein
MDAFDFKDEAQSAQHRSALIWNILTILALLGVACIGCLFLTIFTNPRSAFNPFPPPTLPAVMQLPSSTPTSSVILPATWTPTFTPIPTITNTPQPTSTLPPTPTPITLTPTVPATPMTPTPPPGGYAYEVRQGSPKAIPNIYHPELACNWMGVGGQAIDMNNSPVTGLIIKLGGRLTGVNIPDHLMSLTGVALDYGRAGYEFKLADTPIASKASLWVQLLDQSGVPLSDQVFFDTYSSCDKNLIIIDFKRVK